MLTQFYCPKEALYCTEGINRNVCSECRNDSDCETSAVGPNCVGAYTIGVCCAECNHAPVTEREHEAWLFIVARTIMQIIAVTQDPFLLLLLLHFREYLCLWPFLHKK